MKRTVNALLALLTTVMLGTTLTGTQQSLSVEAALEEDTLQTVAVG